MFNWTKNYAITGLLWLGWLWSWCSFTLPRYMHGQFCQSTDCPGRCWQVVEWVNDQNQSQTNLGTGPPESPCKLLQRTLLVSGFLKVCQCHMVLQTGKPKVGTWEGWNWKCIKACHFQFTPYFVRELSLRLAVQWQSAEGGIHPERNPWFCRFLHLLMSQKTVWIRAKK